MKDPQKQKQELLLKMAINAHNGELNWFDDLLKKAGYVNTNSISVLGVANLFAITKQAIGLWHSKEGCPRRNDNTYDLGQVIRWRMARLDAEYKKRFTESDPALERKRRAEAEIAEIQLAKIKSEILTREEVELGQITRITVIKRALIGLGRSLAPVLEGLERREIQAAINERMRRLIDEFSGREVEK